MEEGKEFASINDMDFLETSAKTDYQVQESFIKLSKDIISTVNTEKIYERRKNSITIKPGKSENLPTKKKKKCCK